jgi:hypothetical protein
LRGHFCEPDGFSELRDRAAKAGYTVRLVTDRCAVAYLVSRWKWSKQISSIDELSAFVDQFAGRPVSLIDGRIVNSWSEEWRLECASRHRETQEVAARDPRPAQGAAPPENSDAAQARQVRRLE